MSGIPGRNVSLLVLIALLSLVSCSRQQPLRPQSESAEARFQRALSEGPLEEISNLLQEHPELANQKNPGGWTPAESVLLSQRKDRNEILKELIVAGADVNAKSVSGYEVPLITAADRGDDVAVALLITHGAYVNATDGMGRTALDHAAYFSPKHGDVARLLVSSGARENLLDAAFLGDAAVADGMLKKDPGLENLRADMPKLTPFEAAILPKAKTGDGSVLEVMLPYKPKLSLFEAAALGRTDIVKAFLLNAPYLVLERDGSEQTALDWALRGHEYETAAFLLDQGAVPTINELQRAIFDSDEESVRLLVQHNVPKDQLIPGFGYPYQIALRRHETSIAELLK